MKNVLFLAAALTAVAISPSMAGPIGVDLGYSIFGPSLEARYELSDRVALRANHAGASLSGDFEGDSGDRLSGNLDLGASGVWLDYHPFRSAFRISAGGFATDLSASVSGSNVSISGVTTDVDARIEPQQDFMPALALGFTKTVGSGLTFNMDAGALFGDGFSIDAREATGLVPQDDVDAYVEDNFGELEDIKALPYVRMGVGWTF